MLHITIPAREYYDEDANEFIQVKEQTLTMEHSLISVSKWEAKWKKPFLSKNRKTEEEVLDYLRCMTIGKAPDPIVYRSISKENVDEITAYIDDPMTATTINNLSPKSGRQRVVTSELIYYWMIAQNIPPEYEKWHLNRLMTLIRICSIENNPNKKKMSRAEIARQNKALNAARRAKYGTKG